MPRRGIFVFDSLSPSLQRMFPTIDAAVDVTFDAMAPRAASMMRQNAPWKDRTGNARAGLMAKHDSTPMVEHTLTLYHSMPYGIWLEVRWSGRYAIIGPTMVQVGQDLAVTVAAAVHRAVTIAGGST